MKRRQLLVSIALTLVGVSGFAGSLHSVARAENPGEHASNDTFYTCPMHPNVRSKEPGECPICHMKLQKVTSGGQSELEGRGPVRMDSTQLSLSGTHLVKVKRKALETFVQVAGRVLSPSKMSIQIQERDLRFVKPGLEIELESPASPDRKLMGRVTSFDSILDPMTRSLRADVQITRSNPILRSEMSATGKIRIRKDHALVVPESAVLYLNSKSYVFIAYPEKNALLPKVIRTGIKNPTEIEVLEGLEEADSIAAGPNFLIDSESRISASHD